MVANDVPDKDPRYAFKDEIIHPKFFIMVQYYLTTLMFPIPYDLLL